MEKCVESVQIWIKCINVEEKVVGFFGEEMCWRSSTAIAFCNDIEHVRPCWMFRTWQPPSSPSTTSCDRIWFCHNLNPRSSSSNFFLAFSIISFMPINGAEWPLPLQCFPCVFDVAFSFYGSSPLCWFDDYDLFWGFGYGLARFELMVTIWHENEEYQGVYTYCWRSISKVHWNYEGGGWKILSWPMSAPRRKMFTTCLFQLVYFVISMFIGNLLTNIQVLLVVFWMVLWMI